MPHPPIDSQITFLYTPDLAQTARFYEDIIGLELKLDQGTCRIYQVTQDGYLGFCQQSAAIPQAESNARTVILTIVTTDVDEWYQFLIMKDVQPEHEPAINPDYNIYHFFLRDPDGHLLEFQQFLHPF